MRKPIQVTQEPCGDSLIVLCDDGTIWRLSEGGSWKRIVGVPQESPKEEADLVRLLVEGKYYVVLGIGQVLKGSYYLYADCSAVGFAEADRDYSRILVRPYLQ